MAKPSSIQLPVDRVTAPGVVLRNAAEARAGEADRVATEANEGHDAGERTGRRDRAVSYGQRLAVRADRGDRPRAVGDAGDPDLLADGETRAVDGCREDDRAAGRGARERDGPGDPVPARDRDRAGQRGGNGGKRGAVHQQDRTVARRSIAVERRVVREARDRPDADARQVHGLADGEPEALPGLAVAQQDAVARQGERGRDGQEVRDRDLAGEGREAADDRATAQEERVAVAELAVGRETGDRVRAAVWQRDLLADLEAVAGPPQPVVTGEPGDRTGRRAGARYVEIEHAIDLEQGVAATVDGRDPAVVRELATLTGDRVEVAARLERALDVEVVVSGAQQDVDDLDRRQRAVGAEHAVRVQADRPVADPAGVLAGLAERVLAVGQVRVGGAQEVGEVEVLAHVQAGEGRRGELARQVFLAAVAVDVERVDLLPLGRLGGDPEDRGIALARQQDRGMKRAVGAGRAALDSERAADAAEQVRLLAERSQAGTPRGELEERIGDERDDDRVVPVAAVGDRARLIGVARRGCGEVRDRGPLVDRQVSGVIPRQLVRREQAAQRRAGERDLVGPGGIGPADQLDLEQALRAAVLPLETQTRSVPFELELDQLSLEEAVVEPAAVVGADERAGDLVDRGVVHEARTRRVPCSVSSLSPTAAIV